MIKKIIALSIISVIMLFTYNVVAGQSSQNDTTNEIAVLRNEALKLINSGQYGPAEVFLLDRLKIEKDPQAIFVIHSFLGKIYMFINKLEKAVENFDKALAISPNDGPTHFNKGCLLRKIPGKLKDAVVEFEKAKANDCQYAMLSVALGGCYKDLYEVLISSPELKPEEKAEADGYFNKAVEVLTNRSYMEISSSNALADLYYSAGIYEVALKHNLFLFQQAPGGMQGARLAHTYIALGKIDEAVDILNKTIDRLDKAISAQKNYVDYDGKTAEMRALFYVYFIEAMQKSANKAEELKYAKILLELTSPNIKPRTKKMDEWNEMAQKIITFK